MTRAPRIAIGVSILTLVVAVVGFVVAIVLNAFVLDEFDAYGEVDIPGSGSLALPEGEVTISFHTLITGGPAGGGLPVPQLQLSMTPPDGVPEPEVTESFGGTTTVNSDARVRVWVAQIREAGTYEIATDGSVGGYIAPRLAFGRDHSRGWVLWLFGALFVVGLLELFASLMWSARVNKKSRPLGPDDLLIDDPLAWYSPPVAPVAAGHEPNDQGIRLEQLRTLKELHDSGALTDEEFAAEKRRILNS